MVVVPGVEGELGFLPRHEPLVIAGRHRRGARPGARRHLGALCHRHRLRTGAVRQGAAGRRPGRAGGSHRRRASRGGPQAGRRPARPARRPRRPRRGRLLQGRAGAPPGREPAQGRGPRHDAGEAARNDRRGCRSRRERGRRPRALAARARRSPAPGRDRPGRRQELRSEADGGQPAGRGAVDHPPRAAHRRRVHHDRHAARARRRGDLRRRRAAHRSLGPAERARPLRARAAHASQHHRHGTDGRSSRPGQRSPCPAAATSVRGASTFTFAACSGWAPPSRSSTASSRSPATGCGAPSCRSTIPASGRPRTSSWRRRPPAARP